MEFSLLGAALVAAAGGWVGLRLAVRRGFAEPSDGDVLLGAAIVGLAVGRLASMVATGTNPLTHPVDVLLVRGGVDTGWASTAAILYAARVRSASSDADRRRVGPSWIPRIDLRNLDRLAVPGLFALAGWHLGCLVTGTCLGVASTWTWLPSDSGIGRHPVELYTAFVLLVGGIVVLRSRLLHERPGRDAGAALLLASGARLVTEPLRLSIGGGPIGWYLAGVVVGALIWLRSTMSARRTTAR